MKRRPPLSFWILTLCSLALILGLTGPLQAADAFSIKDVRTRVDEGVVTLDADIEFRFSPEALEALDNGVPLTIVLHFQVRDADAWIWEDSVADLRLRYAVRYKPLSERYEVYRLPGERGRSFVSREAAIAALGELRGLQIVDQKRLDPESKYVLHMKAELDLEELPLPLRPIAYLRPAWKLGTSWTKWPLTR
ncbi:MAG: DUF4390 domain-containing protein [Bdellovibrio bacteriovorus]